MYVLQQAHVLYLQDIGLDIAAAVNMAVDMSISSTRIPQSSKKTCCIYYTIVKSL